MGMSKEELIEAVNGTLISNEEKAITADALRNLLTDIVENSGSSGGGGMTFQVGLEINEDGVNFTVTPEQIAHNKEQIDILKQLHDEGKPTPPIAIEAIGIAEGMTVSKVMYVVSVMWDILEGVTPEDIPEGIIFPVVQAEIMINGDGTLIML
jgi:hypothetical protein